jgi:hypothetical protein
MKKLKIAISLVTVALIASACGAGTESSNTTERTRNSTASPFANIVMYIAGDDEAGRSKIYEYSFNSAGIPTVSELVDTAQDGNTGITGVAFDATEKTLYWAQQESSTTKIQSLALTPGASTNTLYTIAGTYPYTLALDVNYQHILWSVQTTSGIKIWRGDKLSSPAVEVKLGDVRGLSPYGNSVLAIEGSNIYSYPITSPGRTRLVHTTTGGGGWATMYDSMTNDIYYVTDFVSGTNSIVKVAAGVETVVATGSKRVMSMAMTFAGNIIWADGPRPSRLDPVGASQINFVNPSNPSESQTLELVNPLKVTSLWIVEAPSIVMDPEIEGGGTVGTEYICNYGSWSQESGGTRSSQSPLNLGYSIEWHQDGVVIPGATDDVFVPEFGGRLKCVVTASNAAGTGTAQSLELDVVGPSASTLAPSGSDSTTTSTVAGESPATTVAPRYKSISVKWSYSSSKKLLTGTFKKVAGARTYSLTMTGATKKTVKCTTSGTKVTCKATLKKGANVITVNAKNASQVIIAQKRASKTVR